jgi:hypothetical protein
LFLARDCFAEFTLSGAKGLNDNKRAAICHCEEQQRRGNLAPTSELGIKHHGDSTEIYLPVIQAVLRRFEIDPDEFWKR